MTFEPNTTPASTTPSPRIALIVGATGNLGSEVAKALLRHGYTVRALSRDPVRASKSHARLGSVQWRSGDALNPEDVIAAAAGASVIVHAANPAGYRNWKGLALPMLEGSIAAARSSGARLVLPGNVYNFGPDAPDVVDEAFPERPVTRKGKIRVAMEARLREVAAEGVTSLVVRAGDYFGPGAPGTWFGQGLVKPGKALRSVMYPGVHDAGHAWAYLPDLAETIVQLLDRADELQPHDVFHFAGHSLRRGVEIAEATRVAAGVPTAPIRRFPWFLVYMLAPFIETFRELLEMRYLWSRTLLLDQSKLERFLGRVPHTPLESALETTLQGLGCVPKGGAPSRRVVPAESV